MVAGRPWYQRNPADFLMATAHYDLEVKGAYSIILDLLNDRDRPIPDEDRFIAGQLGCTVHKWRKIRGLLIADHKLVEHEGYLTNPRFERERAKRRGDEEAARLWGRVGGLKSAALRQGELDLDAGWHDDDQPPDDSRARARTESTPIADKQPRKSRETAQQTRKFPGNDRQKPPEKPSENNGRAQPPPQATRAREESRVKSIESPTHPNRSASDSRVALDDLELEPLCQAVCDAAGHQPTNPEQTARALRHVEQWKAQGVSFDQVVIPTIRSIISKTSEPTRTLGRFKPDIAHEHARAVARGGRAAYEPPVQLTIADDPDPRIGPLRERLRSTLGARTYDGWLRPTALSIDDRSLTVIAPSPFMADWVRTHFGELLAKVASVDRVEVRCA